MALVSVLWLAAFMAVLAAGLMLAARNSAYTADAMEKKIAGENLADAAVYLAIRDLCMGPESRIDISGRPREVDISGKTLTISVQADAGLIDINFAHPTLLAALFEKNGMGPGEAARIADVIETTRKAAPFYFRRREDIRQIEDITPALYEKIAPALTVYSQQATVDIATAPPQVLMALPNMDKATVDAILLARETPSGPEGYGQKGYEGQAFSIAAQGAEGRVHFSRRAVVRVTGDPRQPYWVLDWN